LGIDDFNRNPWCSYSKRADATEDLEEIKEARLFSFEVSFSPVYFHSVNLLFFGNVAQVAWHMIFFYLQIGSKEDIEKFSKRTVKVG